MIKHVMLALAQRRRLYGPAHTQTTCCSFNQSTKQRLPHGDNQELCLLPLDWGEGGRGERQMGAGDGQEGTRRRVRYSQGATGGQWVREGQRTGPMWERRVGCDSEAG